MSKRSCSQREWISAMRGSPGSVWSAPLSLNDNNRDMESELLTSVAVSVVEPSLLSTNPTGGPGLYFSQRDTATNKLAAPFLSPSSVSSWRRAFPESALKRFPPRTTGSVERELNGKNGRLSQSAAPPRVREGVYSCHGKSPSSFMFSCFRSRLGTEDREAASRKNPHSFALWVH